MGVEYKNGLKQIQTIYITCLSEKAFVDEEVK